jgi:membrane protease YdiL (CAAX protease family)
VSIPPPLAPAAPGPPPDPPELPEGVERRPPRWPAWTAPLALFAALALTLFGGVVIALASAATGSELSKLPPAARIASVLFQDVALIASAVAFAALAARPRAWHFGLRRAPWRRFAGGLVAVWVGFFAFSAAWVNALGIEQRDRLPKELGVDESTAALVAVTVLVTVVAPIAEEVFFRGYFFAALRSWTGAWPAAAITGVVFGAIHAGSAPVGYLVPLAVFGFGLCVLYWQTGSLYPCIVLHALNNALALGVTEEWRWWQVLAVMAGANLLIAAILLPLARSSRGAPRPAAALP